MSTGDQAEEGKRGRAHLPARLPEPSPAPPHPARVLVTCCCFWLAQAATNTPPPGAQQPPISILLLLRFEQTLPFRQGFTPDPGSGLVTPRWHARRCSLP